MTDFDCSFFLFAFALFCSISVLFLYDIQQPFFVAGMLSLKDLVNMITEKLRYHLLQGEELYGKRDDSVYLCQILKVLEEGDNKIRYEVAWLDKDKKKIGTAVVNVEDLIRKKLPFTREVLKSFIRESTCRNVPWVLHDKLAQEHAISTDPPEELRGKYFFKDGQLVSCKKKRKSDDDKQDINVLIKFFFSWILVVGICYLF